MLTLLSSAVRIGHQLGGESANFRADQRDGARVVGVRWVGKLELPPRMDGAVWCAQLAATKMLAAHCPKMKRARKMKTAVAHVQRRRLNVVATYRWAVVLRHASLLKNPARRILARDVHE